MCFNGAGPRRARRVIRMVWFVFSPMLQWGRATEGPERFWHHRSLESFILCFNGAGPRRARREEVKEHQNGVSGASMGPGHGGPGEAMTSGSPSCT